MRGFALTLLVASILGLTAQQLSSQTAPRRAITAAEYESWKKDLSNWGRWGKDDQIGAINLITPAKRKEAAALVKEGFSVSLAGDADTVKAVDNPFPYEHEMLAIGNDRISVRYHGIAHCHLDSLAHINENGVFYNGYKPDADAVLKLFQDADHSFHVPARTGRKDPQVRAEMLDALVGWIDTVIIPAL